MLKALKAPDSCDVAVIGGGITGLVLGYRLARAGMAVRLFEAGERVGGVIRSERLEGSLLELGPFSVMLRSPEFSQLLDELALEPATVDAGRSRRRFVQIDGELRQVPGSLPGLLTSGFLSLRGRLDLLRRILTDGRPDPSDPPTLHELGSRRFGREFADHLVGPGTMGIFGAEAWELEAEACMPAVHEEDLLQRTTVGLVRGIRRKAAPAPPRRLMSLEGGLATLVDRIAERLGGSILTGARVSRIDQSGGGFEVAHSDGRELLAGSVVLGVGPQESARLVSNIAPSASELLGGIRVAGLGVVHLTFERGQVGRDLDGFGYLVPASEDAMNPVLGVIWPGSVFPAHEAEGTTTIRVMVGGTRWPLALSLDDETLVSGCLERIRSVHRIKGQPKHVDVTRWHSSVPVYEVGHAARIRSIADSISRTPGLAMAGSWICPPHGGIGVNDRVRHAHEVADEISSFLGDRSRRPSGSGAADGGPSKKVSA